MTVPVKEVVSMAKIVVVGSINIDLLLKTSTLPLKGETVFGDYYKKTLGGKGANQAVAASRLGSSVSIIGAVGNDEDGKLAIKHLKNEGVNVEGIDIVDDNTGFALVTVHNKDNTIIVVKGANDKLTTEWIDKKYELIKNADIVLLQFEIPMLVVEHVSNLCSQLDIDLIVNPAPYKEMSAKVLNNTKYLIPNETEFDQMDASILKDKLHDNRLKVIVTQGENGVLYRGKDGAFVRIDAVKVNVVDTTGAEIHSAVHLLIQW